MFRTQTQDRHRQPSTTSMYTTAEELVDVEVGDHTYTVPSQVLIRDSARFRELLQPRQDEDEDEASHSVKTEIEFNFECVANAIESITPDTVPETVIQISRYMQRILLGTRTSPPISPEHLGHNYLADLIVDKGLRCPQLVDTLFKLYVELGRPSGAGPTIGRSMWIIDQRMETVLRALFDAYCLGNGPDAPPSLFQHSPSKEEEPKLPHPHPHAQPISTASRYHAALAHMLAALFHARIKIGFSHAENSITASLRLLLPAAHHILETEDRYPPQRIGHHGSDGGTSRADALIESLYIIFSKTGRALWQDSAYKSTELAQWVMCLRSMESLLSGNARVMISGLLDMHKNNWPELQDGETTCPTSPSSSQSSSIYAEVPWNASPPGFASRAHYAAPSNRRRIKLNDVTPAQFSALVTYYMHNGGYHPIFLCPAYKPNGSYSFPTVPRAIILDLLVVITTYRFHHAQDFALAAIEALPDEDLPPIERICLVEKMLGNAPQDSPTSFQTYADYEKNIQWLAVLEPAYQQLVDRDHSITLKEAEKIGSRTTAMIAARREEKIRSEAVTTAVTPTSTSLSRRSRTNSTVSRSTGTISCRSRSRSTTRSSEASSLPTPPSVMPIPPPHVSPGLFGPRSPRSSVSTEVAAPSEYPPWLSPPFPSVKREESSPRQDSSTISPTRSGRSRGVWSCRTPSPSRFHPTADPNAQHGTTLIHQPTGSDGSSTPSVSAASTWEKFFMATYVNTLHPGSTAGSPNQSKTRSSPPRTLASSGGSILDPQYPSPPTGTRRSRDSSCVVEVEPVSPVIATISRPSSPQNASSANSTPSILSVELINPRRSVSPRPVPPPRWGGSREDPDAPSVTSTWYGLSRRASMHQDPEDDLPRSPPDSPSTLHDLETNSIPPYSPGSSRGLTRSPPMHAPEPTVPSPPTKTQTESSRDSPSELTSSLFWRPDILTPGSDTTEHSRAPIINYPFWFSDMTMPEVDQVAREPSQSSGAGPSNTTTSATAVDPDTSTRTVTAPRPARFYF